MSSGPSKCDGLQLNSFVEKVYVTLATSVCVVGLRKDKGLLEQSVSVEKPEGVNRKVRESWIRCDESCKLTI